MIQKSINSIATSQDETIYDKYEFCCIIGHHRFMLPNERIEAENKEAVYLRALISSRVLSQVKNINEPPPDSFPKERWSAPVYRCLKKSEHPIKKWEFHCLLCDF